MKYEILKKKINKENIIVGIIILILAILVSMQSSAFRINKDSYLSIDVAVWTNIGKMMSEGRVMYRDVFDHKGPMLLIFYCVAYSIGKYIGIWLLDFISILASEIIIYKIARRFDLDKYKAISISGISMAFLSQMCLENPCTESLALPFILLSLYEFMKFFMDTKTFEKKESIYTGICLGIVLLMRPNLASIWVVYDLYIFIKMLKDKKIKELFNIIIFSFLGLAIAFIPIAIYLLVNNAFMDFINTYLIFNLKYANLKDLSFISTIKYFLGKDNINLIISVLIINITLLVYMYKRKDKNLMIIITSFIWFIFTFYLVIMPQRGYIHYLIPILPTLIMPIVISLKNIKVDKNVFYAFMFFVIIFVSIELIVKLNNNEQNSEQIENLQDMAEYIQMNTNKDDNVLMLGNLTESYLKTDREYKGKYFYQIPIAYYSEEICDEIINEIKDNLPSIICINNCDLKRYYSEEEIRFKKEINKILKENYTKLDENIFIRKEEQINE